MQAAEIGTYVQETESEFQIGSQAGAKALEFSLGTLTQRLDTGVASSDPVCSSAG